jgi:hypothetical protein
MNSAGLDTLILDTLEGRWKKIAMVVALVARNPRFVENEFDDDFEIIASHILRLVDAGRIECQGSLTDWRYGEIRLRD